MSALKSKRLKTIRKQHYLTPQPPFSNLGLHDIGLHLIHLTKVARGLIGKWHIILAGQLRSGHSEDSSMRLAAIILRKFGQ